jgi:CDP-paratose 2-epimerase
MKLITGGAGFVGSNLADYLMEKGEEVIVFDNLSRKGVDKNLEWLRSRHKFEFIKGDVTDRDLLIRTAKDCEIIFHTAAQVAVTTSVQDPVKDFETNAVGTFNALEAARKNNSSLIFCSTNKVYGDNVNRIPLLETALRYEFAENKDGVKEDFPLDAREHTPYGSSKLAADQYVRDYSVIYGISTVVNRMSCIYGTRQFGTTDQGWVVHFIKSAIMNQPLIIYGDGKQVRDILFVRDLVELFEKEFIAIKKLSGEAYNVGGGTKNIISLLELISILEELTGRKISYKFSDWRPADQKVYYSDIRKVNKELGWSPKVGFREGIEKTFDWVSENKSLFD